MTGAQQTLEGTGALDRSLSQFFTPAWLAARVWQWAGARCPLNVLEPSAGRGALVEAVFASGTHTVTAYEIDPVNVQAMADRWPGEVDGRYLDLRCGNFLSAADRGDVEPHDLSLQNTPFENNQDVRFLEATCKLAPRAIAICQARIVHSQGRAEFWRWHDITREAILSARPRFGGDQGGKTDFVVLEVARRRHARLQGEASTTLLEWWEGNA